MLAISELFALYFSIVIFLQSIIFMQYQSYISLKRPCLLYLIYYYVNKIAIQQFISPVRWPLILYIFEYSQNSAKLSDNLTITHSACISQLLPLYKFSKIALSFNKFLIISLFYYLSIINRQYPVTIFNSRKSVCNNNSCTFQLIQRF